MAVSYTHLLNKVTELINNQVSNSLKEVKASKTQKPKETKESKAYRRGNKHRPYIPAGLRSSSPGRLR